MASPTSVFNLGFVHTPGELPHEDEGLATPEYSYQLPNSHFRPADFVTSYYETNPQHSTAAPIEYKQLFQSDPFFLTLIKPTKLLKSNNFGPPDSPADPPSFLSSHKSVWDTVAHWETNGTDFSPKSQPVALQMMPTPLKRTTVPMPAQYEAAPAMRPIPKPRMSLFLSTTRITILPIDSSLQSEQTVSDQWQIAPNVPEIVNIISDVPEADDSIPVPSSIHRDSLAPLISTPSSPLSL